MALRQVKDTPTNNFATWNILNYESHSFSQGNLSITSSGTGIAYANFSIPDSGKWYCEIRFNGGGNYSYLGVQPPLGGFSERFRILAKSDGNIYKNSSSGGVTHDFQGENYMSSWTGNDIISMMCDSDNEILTFYKNGAEITPNLPFNFTDFKHPDNRTRTFFTLCNSGLTHVANFGQNPTFSDTEPSAVTGGNNPDGSWSDANGQGSFYYEPPAGALALCSQNIQSVEQDGSYVQNYVSAKGNFRAVTWIGDGTTSRQITHNLGFDPDLVWIKNRDGARFGLIADSVRGKWDQTNGYRILVPSTNNGDDISNWSANYRLIDKSATTFSVNDGVSNNESGKKFIAWCWKAGGSPSGSTSATGSAKRINSSGTQDDTSCSALATAATNAGASNVITPTLMSINQKAGFSIVKYPGGSDVNTIPHGLNSAPEMIIIKNLDNANGWVVGSSYLSNWAKGLGLDIPDGEFDATSSFNSTAPDNNVFTLGNSSGANNSSYNYIAYCWHSVAGYSKIGSYKSNGSADGPFVYCGFRPAWVMVKRTTTSDNWFILDNERNESNPVNSYLMANSSNQEDPNNSTVDCDFLSNGFKIRATTTGLNATGSTYIYMAFAEQPFIYSNAR